MIVHIRGYRGLKNMSKFSENLKKARIYRGLKQFELAPLCNIRPTILSLFENGRRNPNFDNLIKIANALDVSIDYLVGRISDFEITPTISSNPRIKSNAYKEIIKEFIKMLSKLEMKQELRGK